jgi:hypothetical protein
MTTQTDRQPTCADRLPDHLRGRLADFRTMLDRDDPGEPTDPDDINEPGSLYEYPLGVSVSYAVRVELSTGGPADYLTATVSAGEVEHIAYHFADWGDHAERALDGDEFDTARDFIAQLVDLDDLGQQADA